MNVGFFVETDADRLAGLKTRFAQGPPEDADLVHMAAYMRHIRCVQWLHENGCRGNALTCAIAAMNGDINCLKYLHEHGCPWDISASDAAAQEGNLECLQYLHEHGCPCRKEHIVLIAKERLLPLWRAWFRTRAIGVYWLDLWARVAHAPEGEGRKRDRKEFEADDMFSTQARSKDAAEAKAGVEGAGK